jgi:hypothetical protein
MNLNEADFKLINKKGNIGEFVYKSENYPGPIAINATIRKEDANKRKCPTIQSPTTETL